MSHSRSKERKELESELWGFKTHILRLTKTSIAFLHAPSWLDAHNELKWRTGQLVAKVLVHVD